ncbi:hypothetical protein P280DRAFT_464606 [Massarina eburnea CBS 473.64]|uniref:Uncharacterized protein n=1 Tax=Massarina eburnea CBS 473.64 TaxID=1395130 RepID=A0A6A6SJG3_9PLEO|nr:hypothetical protein P280DRAFT_464606 [Massarina eburnea CBS 473.64]
MRARREAISSAFSFFTSYRGSPFPAPPPALCAAPLPPIPTLPAPAPNLLPNASLTGSSLPAAASPLGPAPPAAACPPP